MYFHAYSRTCSFLNNAFTLPKDACVGSITHVPIIMLVEGVYVPFPRDGIITGGIITTTRNSEN